MFLSLRRDIESKTRCANLLSRLKIGIILSMPGIFVLCFALIEQERPQYHSPQTSVAFQFPKALHYAMINETRWKTIKYR